MNSTIIYDYNEILSTLWLILLLQNLRDILMKYFALKDPSHKTKPYISNNYYHIKELQFSNNKLRRISQGKNMLKL